MLRKIIAYLALLCLVGCGYTLQGTRNELLKEAGINRIYIQPVNNQTFKPGVNILIYNELIRMISLGKQVRIVDRPEYADAVLESAVVSASYAGVPSTTANNLFYGPAQDRPSLPSRFASMPIATEYTAVLNCQFSLRVKNPRAGAPAVFWSGGFGRAKPFPAANQLGVYGNTSALINDSEFDRALQDLARSMMVDVAESMLAQF